jgi:hypothetical protein
MIPTLDLNCWAYIILARRLESERRPYLHDVAELKPKERYQSCPTLCGRRAASYPSLVPRKEAEFQEQNPELYEDQPSGRSREAYIYAPGITIGIGIGLISGDVFDTCSAVSDPEEFFTSSTEPMLFLSNRRSSTIFLNGGRMAGSLCQQTCSSSFSAGVLKRESGMTGRMLSSKCAK